MSYPHTSPLPASVFEAERVLADVSRLLVSGGGADLHQVLALLCEALGARSAHFAFAPEPFISSAALGSPTDAAHPSLPAALAGQVLVWPPGSPSPTASSHAVRLERPETRAAGRVAHASTAGTGSLTLPLLTEDDRFVGYMGVETDRAPDDGPDSPWRLLPVLGDIIGAHLSRLAAEEGRMQSQSRWQSLVDHHPDAIVITADGQISYANPAATRLFGAHPDALQGAALSAFLLASDEDTIELQKRRQLASPSPRPFKHTLIRFDGSERIVESLSVPFPGVVDAVQTVLRDVTERIESAERYRTFVETISGGIWRIDLGTPIPRGNTPAQEAHHVVAHGVLAELNPAMAQMIWDGSEGMLGTRVEDLDSLFDYPLFRALAESGHRLHNYEVAVRSASGKRQFLSVNAVGRFERDALVGVWGSCTEITERVAMESGMVDALEEQQERIGRDLHDSVGQLLTGARMLSENLAERVQNEENATIARRIAAYTAEAIDRVRAICRGLVPPQLYQEGVAAALAELVTHVDALNLTRCIFEHDGRADLREADVALQFYRIAQEAISNALKHAHPATVQVSFYQDDTGVVMEIRDDGVGFELDQPRPRSIGLFSLRRRAHSAGAILTIESQPGHGTAVRVSQPL